MRRFKFWYIKLKKFFHTDVWHINIDQISGFKAFLIRQIRIIILTIKGYSKDRCSLRASALTYLSILSVVPVLAMGFGIAKGFGLENILRKQIMKQFTGQEEIMNYSLEFANNMLGSTQGGMIAGVGMIFLFYIVMRLLNSIEESMNDIWEVKKARSPLRKFSDYLAIMLIAPLLIIMASSLNVFIISQIKTVTQSVTFFHYLSPFIQKLVQLIPYTLVWILLTIIYMIMPNTGVNFKSALIAGILAGTSFQLTQWAYMNFQIGVSRYNTIYGSFAALPLFLIWMQVSWTIILTGSEFAFSHQNVKNYEYEYEKGNISFQLKKYLSLLILKQIVHHFVEGKPPATKRQISKRFQIPGYLTKQIIWDLIECGLVSEVKWHKRKKTGFQPAKDTSLLTIAYVIDKLEKQGKNFIAVSNVPEKESTLDSLEKIKFETDKSSGNRLLKNI